MASASSIFDGKKNFLVPKNVHNLVIDFRTRFAIARAFFGTTFQRHSTAVYGFNLPLSRFNNVHAESWELNILAESRSMRRGRLRSGWMDGATIPSRANF